MQRATEEQRGGGGGGAGGGGGGGVNKFRKTRSVRFDIDRTRSAALVANDINGESRFVQESIRANL